MDKIRILGGRPLVGQVPISGAKNAALPLMAAALLTECPLTLSGLPELADVQSMAKLLGQLGVEIGEAPEINGAGEPARRLTLQARKIESMHADYDLVRKMRASVLVLGPLLARTGRAQVSLPGGCAIGTRPVDLHLSGLEALGAEIELKQGYIEARAPGGLVGGEVVFPHVSVGATENLMMAASLARGRTRLLNAAREPEIGDLAACLNAMGAHIEGAGSDVIEIEGVAALGGAEHTVIPDRIETGTYALAAAITGGELELLGARIEHNRALFELLDSVGVSSQATARGLKVQRKNGALAGADVMTEPYPGFPTDLQAQFMAVMAVAEGAAMITETIFENRFMHVPELMRMGARVTVHGASAMVRGQSGLYGAPVMATDLRASVSLVLAALAAQGETTVNRVYHLDRGYERLEAKLRAVGAEIERVQD